MSGFGWILSIFALLGFVLFLAGVGLFVMASSQGRSNRGGVILAAIGLLIGVIFSILGQGILNVGPTEVAVVFNTLNGQFEEPPRGPGTHIITPVITTYTLLPTNQQEYTMSATNGEGRQAGDDAVDARTQDGQSVSLDVTILYAVNPLKANVLFQEWREAYEENFVRPVSRSIVRDVVSGYRAADIYGLERGQLEIELETQMRTALESQGLELTDFLVRDITFSDEFAAAIERAQVAEQETAQARLRVEQRRQEADQARAVAEGERDAAIAQAEGEAQSIILHAQAEAQALRLVSEQLAANPLLIQYEYIQNLSDNVRLMMVPSNSPFLFDAAMLGEADPNFVPPEVPEPEVTVVPGN
jgi:regulator of protease activity HflC (stomatin/prohibitin superfamily)